MASWPAAQPAWLAGQLARWLSQQASQLKMVLKHFSVMFRSGSVWSSCQNAPGANFRSGPVVSVLPVVVSGPVRLLVFSVWSGPVVDFGHAHVKE